MSYFAPSLPGMETGIAPRTSRSVTPEEYRRTAQKYAARPLPPIPPVRTMSPEMPRPRTASRNTIRPQQRGRPLPVSDSKPLPLPPSPPYQHDDRSSRRTSISSPPTGHRSTQKAQELIGCDVDVYDDTRDGTPSPGAYRNEPTREYCQREVGRRLARGDETRIVAGLPTPPGQDWPMRPGTAPGKPRTEQRHPVHPVHPVHPILASHGQQCFSDAKTALDYHKIAVELATDRPSPERTRTPPPASMDPYLCKQSSGFGGRTRMLPHSSRRRPPPQPIEVVSRSEPLLGREWSPQTPFTGERPDSAFESDSEDDGGSIMSSLRGFVGIRTSGSSGSRGRRRNRPGQQFQQQSRGGFWLGPRSGTR